MKQLFSRKWFISILAIFAAWFGWQYVYATTNLTWTAPTTNTDGSPLTDLGSYRVYRGNSSGGAKTLLATVTAPVTAYQDSSTLEGLNCYAITAVDLDGNESNYSNEACKFVDTIAPNAPTGLIVN